jgi:stage IV sporulation protein B
MNFMGSYRKRFVVFLAVCFTVIALSYIRTIAVLPNRITILEGDEYTYHFHCPFLVNVRADREGVIILNNKEIKARGSFFSLSSPISMKSQTKGSVHLHWKVFGLIPLKTMQVDIMPNKKVVACGNTIGVKLKIHGILVLGLTEVETVGGKRSLPAREGGIRSGDLLLEANQKKLSTINDLVREIEGSQGNKITLKFKRGDSHYDVTIRPVQDADDQKYHIGLWVRDSTAGIGTLTFYDPETLGFGALGHGITDIDTGTLMPVENGEILESRILGIKKGQSGVPGELKGVFIEDRSPLGIIRGFMGP